jgi:hypothetical protein
VDGKVETKAEDSGGVVSIQPTIGQTKILSAALKSSDYRKLKANQGNGVIGQTSRVKLALTMILKGESLRRHSWLAFAM